MERSEQKQIAQDCLQDFKQRMTEIGFEVLPEIKLFIGYPTTGYFKDAYGSYDSMSQFTNILKIRVYPDNVLRLLKKKLQTEEVTQKQYSNEILLTIAHEFGHSMCEVFKVLKQNYPELSVPIWTDAFDDEEEFVEEFAQLLEVGTLDLRLRSKACSARYFWPNLIDRTIDLYKTHIQIETT